MARGRVQRAEAELREIELRQRRTADQIRVELDLMDWQLGLLSGFAFAVFYSVLGLPIAHISERFGRKRVVAIAIAFWSVMTALSGAARSYAHLLVLRIGVGVGEAGGSPPSHSMIWRIGLQHCESAVAQLREHWNSCPCAPAAQGKSAARLGMR